MEATSLLEVTDADFEEKIVEHSENDTPAIVDFWAEWCGPCKAIGPIVKELAKEYEGRVRVAKLDVDSSPKTPMQYGVRGIPSILMFKGGKLEDTVVGAVSKPLLVERIDALLSP